MVKNLVVICLVFLFSTFALSGLEMTIKVFPRGGAIGPQWHLKYNDKNIITDAIKVTASGEILEKLIVTIVDNHVVSDYTAGAYTLHQKIELKSSTASNQYTEVNTFTKKNKSGKQKLEVSGNVISDFLNEKLFQKFSYKEKWLEDASGNIVLKRDGNTIKSYTDIPNLLIQNEKAGVKITALSNPQIEPADIYILSTLPPTMDDEAILANYLTIPSMLQYLLFL